MLRRRERWPFEFVVVLKTEINEPFSIPSLALHFDPGHLLNLNRFNRVSNQIQIFSDVQCYYTVESMIVPPHYL